MHSKVGLSRGAALLGCVLLFLCLSCTESCRSHNAAKRINIGGQTMGTFYSVVIELGPGQGQGSADEIKAKIDERLEEINDLFSTYRPSSVISRFNKHKQGSIFATSGEFNAVVRRSLEIEQETSGAFNISLDALIDLWGFDKSGRIDKKPDQNAIARAHERMDLANLVIDDRGVRKLRPDMTINLSGIAKGYGVDQVADLLVTMGYANILVEIGGEIVARGEKAQGQAWAVGIEDPSQIFSEKKVLVRLRLHDQGLASSGTYLNNFVGEDGETYSHIIDPRTGYPIKRDLVSVTVVAPDCMTADALATSFMVLGRTDSLRVLEGMPDVSAMFVSIDDDKPQISYANGFERLMLTD